MAPVRLRQRSWIVLSNLDPASSLAIVLLIFSLLLVIAFEATNGFHDAANAVATVIYPHASASGGLVRYGAIGVALPGPQDGADANKSPWAAGRPS
jgi:hypothetical protein